MKIIIDSIPDKVTMSIDNNDEKIFIVLSPDEAEQIALLLLDRAQSAKTP